MKKILRTLKMGIQIYKGYQRYLVMSVITGAFLFFAKPLLSPLVVKKVFDSLTAGDMAAVNQYATAGLIVLLLLILTGYFLIVYADAWMIYLTAGGCIYACKLLYEKPAVTLKDSFPSREQFTRIAEGADAPSGAVVILVQCIAMTLSGAVILWNLFLLSPVLFSCSLFYLILEYLGIRKQMKKQYALQQRLQENQAVFNGAVENVIENADQLLFLEEGFLAQDAVLKSQCSLWKTKVQSNRVKCAFQFYSDMIYSVLKVAAYCSLKPGAGMADGRAGAVNTMLESLRDSSETTINYASLLPECLAAMDRMSELLDFETERLHEENPAAAGGPAVALEHASLACGDRIILDDVTLSIQPGDKVALLGENGAGKTTLLQAILGERGLDAGKIYLNGTAAARLSHEMRETSIGVIPVDCQLYSVSAAQNIEMGRPAKDEGWMPADEEFYERGAGQLSAGQKRRTNILRALQKGPSILLADEPDADLDAQNAEKYMGYMLRRAETVIVITHNCRVPEQFDYILKLENGKLNRYNYGGQ